VVLSRIQLKKIKSAKKVSNIGNTREYISAELFSTKLLLAFFLIQMFN